MPFHFLETSWTIAVVDIVSSIPLCVSDLVFETGSSIFSIDREWRYIPLYFFLVRRAFVFINICIHLFALPSWLHFTHHFYKIIVHCMYGPFKSRRSTSNFVVLHCCKIHKVLAYCNGAFFKRVNLVAHPLRSHLQLENFRVYVEVVLDVFGIIESSILGGCESEEMDQFPIDGRNVEIPIKRSKFWMFWNDSMDS